MSWIGRRALALALVVVASSALVCCQPRSGSPERVRLTVFAASSLTEAFGELERGFEASHPSVDVQLTFAGSQVLRLQIEQGASVDVFASANEAHMQALVDGDLIDAPRVFARNELVLITPKGDPAGVDRFEALTRASRIVIGAENVPVGIYTRGVLERAGRRLGEAFAEQVLARVVSEESNVRLVRAKIELGEADAAFVYRTDAAASRAVRVVPIPSELNMRAGYPMGVATQAPHAAEAQAFIDYARSPEGQRILARRGFIVEPG